MTVAIIDADLIGRQNHRFPNLVCMKLSSYWKRKGKNVILKLDYNNLEEYETVYISKVFTDTPCPISLENVTNYKNVNIGGTGFWFDKAPDLEYEIEHVKPDYDLYTDWIESRVKEAKEEAEERARRKTEVLKIKAEKAGQDPNSIKIIESDFNETRFRLNFKEYTDYSIGFLTRGCFRKCKFCVNQKYRKVFKHSPLEEFYEESRKKICLLDDNFFGFFDGYKPLLEELISKKKPFKFKQGMDERILTQEQCELLFSSKYDGDFTFAFDNVSEYSIIEKQLQLINKYRAKRKGIMFYVLVGFESTDAQDIENAFKRVDLLLRYGCLPYIMRYQSKEKAPWKESKYRSLYVTMARWCNQPSIIKKMTFREFCEANQALHKSDGLCSSMKSMKEFEDGHPEIAKKYFDVRFILHNTKNMDKKDE